MQYIAIALKQSDMKNFRIVITGAPASAKSEFIERLKPMPEFRKFTFFEELARKLLAENNRGRENPEEFHRRIYNAQTKRESELGEKPFITDRGTLDAFAFHPESIELIGTTFEREYRRYSAVLHLGTTATLGKKFYSQDEIRTDSIEEALELEKGLIKIWGGHDSYNYVAAEIEIEQKFSRFITLLKGLINQ